MNHRFSRWATLLLALAFSHATNQAQFKQSHPRLANVVEQFDALSVYPEPLSFRMRGGINGAPAPSLAVDAQKKTHYQGIQRWTGNGVPYLFVSRSGMVDGDYGNVLIVRMGSRERDGERMRSNRLRRDTDTTYTPGEEDDEVVGEIRFAYKHPGGMQICGDILAVPLEDPIESDLPTGRIEFYNIADPEHPQLLNGAINADHNFGVAGLVRLPDGHFLVVATWGSNSQLKFFRSTGTDFNEPGFHFELQDTWSHVELPPDHGFSWPLGTDITTAYQSLSLLLQNDGRLFMIGARNTSVAAPIINGDDLMDLFEIKGFQAGSSRIYLSGILAGAHKICSSEGDSPAGPGKGTNADFLAGAGTYITPSGELLFYAVEHWNLGPIADSARFVEFRHKDLYRPNGPAYHKHVDAGGPYIVDEGATIQLPGRGRGPIAQPWVQLFEDSNFQGRFVLLEWPDRGNDNYEDLGKLDDFNDRTSSFRYWLPPGWMVMLHDDKNFSSTFAPYTGNGTVVAVSDFSNFGVSSVRFIPPSDPGKPIKFTWNLLDPPPNSGTLIEGAIPTEAFFRALDGPANVQAELRAEPEPVANNSTVIQINNVAPVVTEGTISPGADAGNVTLNIQVSDPGRDVVTIRISWGDGVPEEVIDGTSIHQRTFTASHRYIREDGNPNRSYELSITATDDDGAETSFRLSHTIIWQNAVPEGTPDSFTIEQGGVIAALDATGLATGSGADNGVLANDLDFERDKLKAVLMTGPSHAQSFELRSDGTFNYAHDGSFSSTDHFTYKPTDPNGEGAPVVVTIRIKLRNQPPVANPNTVSGILGRSLKFQKSILLVDDTDPEGSPLVLQSVSPRSARGVSVSLSGNWVLYDTQPGIREDSFDYVVSDGEASVRGTVTIILSEFAGETLNIKRQRVAGGDLHFEVAGIPGRTYQLEARTDLRQAWLPVPDPGSAATASESGEVLLIRVTPPPVEFYRVVEQ